MKKEALLIIDVQNDYFPKGKMELFQAEEALKRINVLESLFNERQLPIIYIQHISYMDDAGFFKVNTYGAKLHANLDVNTISIIIEKQYPNSFFQTHLKEQLDQLNVEKLVITGMMTHMCIDATTRAAAEYGYEPVVIADATATKKLQYKDKTVHAADVQVACLAAFQMFAEIEDLETYILR